METRENINITQQPDKRVVVEINTIVSDGVFYYYYSLVSWY